MISAVSMNNTAQLGAHSTCGNAQYSMFSEKNIVNARPIMDPIHRLHHITSLLFMHDKVTLQLNRVEAKTVTQNIYVCQPTLEMVWMALMLWLNLAI
jgi:hypothetical protein